MKYSGIFLPFALATLLACNGTPTRVAGVDSTKITSTGNLPAADTLPKNTPAATPEAPRSGITPATDITYSYFRFKDSGKARMRDYTPEQKKIIYTLNRADGGHLSSVDTVIFPNRFPSDVREISPFPQEVPALREVKKMVLFSYPIQAFAVYENGVLAKWGPTSMGRKTKPTPEGLYFANWKAKETTSTVDDAWKLKWNFNIQNKEGIGWHQYALPGIPASHSCLRLLEEDAKWLYDWADMWVVRNDQLEAQGTPTLVFGEYPWGQRRPWRALLDDPRANDISVTEIEQLVQPQLQKILEKQQQRESVVAGK